MDSPAAYPGSGHDRAETMRPVIAAVATRAGSPDDALSDTRGAAEFASPHHQRFIEQAASRKIIE